MKKSLLIIVIIVLCFQNVFVSYAELEKDNDVFSAAFEYALPDTIPGQWIQAADGRWWYKHNDGSYTTDGWEWIKNSWFYFDSEGWMYTGWLDYGLHRYYLDPSSGAMAMWN